MTYNELLKNGWKMDEIDRMDMLGYLKVRAWALNKEKEAPKKYIDEIWPKGLG